MLTVSILLFLAKRNYLDAIIADRMNDIYASKELHTVPEISVYNLVNILPDAAFICDKTGTITACSDKALAFFGIANKARIIGSNFQSYIAYENIDEAYFLFQNTINEPAAGNSGKFLVKKGISETISSEITFTPIRTDVLEAVTSILITFRKHSQTDAGVVTLQKKNVRLSRLLDVVGGQIPDVPDRARFLISVLGETLGATACSYNQVTIAGLQPEITWESPFNNGISPLLCSQQMLDHLDSQHEQYSLIRKPALTAFLASEPSIAEDAPVKAILGFTIKENGKTTGLITALFTFHYSLSPSDLLFVQTVARAIENEFAGNETTGQGTEVSFRNVADSIPQPVLILSPEGILMEVNKHTGKLFGYEREELIGQNFSLLSAEDKNDETLLQPYFEAAFKGELQQFECYGKSKNGRNFNCEYILNKGLFFGREVLIAIGRDISNSKTEIEELVHQVEELKEANTNKDKFFGVFAHDLKNPFQGLLGFIDLLYEDLEELTHDQVKEYLANVRNASYHTYNLLENLLEWSRIQSGKMPFTPTVFDIREEINSVISVLNNNASQKDINLINEVEAGIMVLADKNMIHSVIQNLITNSIKFSNNNGRVVVRGRKPQKYEKATAKSNPDDKYWLEISISDNGIGIAEEILPKLFKLNGQYSQPGTANEPGTGLGLVLCHEMVEKNGGRIWAESISGQGTTFIFTVQLS